MHKWWLDPVGSGGGLPPGAVRWPRVGELREGSGTSPGSCGCSPASSSPQGLQSPGTLTQLRAVLGRGSGSALSCPQVLPDSCGGDMP